MGNCCVVPTGVVQKKRGKQNKITPIGIEKLGKLVVLDDPTGHDIEARYTLGRELGRGEYGVTYICTDKSSGEVLACKKISKSRLRTPVDIEDVRREVNIMRKMPKHPNIVSFKGVYEDDNAVHLVMELCEGGELYDRIVSRGHYTERAASVIFRTIVEVVKACHQNGVMHRDLKPENFLFTNGKETASLKAIDFGLSVTFTPGQKFNEIVGSPYYMAPEIIKKNYGHEVDIWSAGVILYILLCGSPPFWAVTEHGIAKAVLKPSIDFKKDPWPRVSDTAKDLIKKMLDPNPTQRLTVEQVLDHPWLLNMRVDPNGCMSESVKGRLKRFYVKNKLKKRALRVLGEYLSKEQVHGIKERFALMDTKKRGKINLHELRNGLYKLGHKVSYKDLQFLMEVGDADKDGHLDDNEFVAVAVHLEKMGNDDHLRKTFAFFDKNKSGFIEREELRTSLADELENNGEDVIDAIFQDVDTDKDGRISYDEFATMMKAGTDRRKASKHYSRERFNSLNFKLIKDGSLLKASEL